MEDLTALGKLKNFGQEAVSTFIFVKIYAFIRMIIISPLIVVIPYLLEVFVKPMMYMGEADEIEKHRREQIAESVQVKQSYVDYKNSLYEEYRQKQVN